MENKKIKIEDQEYEFELFEQCLKVLHNISPMIENLINKTPTGDNRNDLTIINILIKNVLLKINDKSNTTVDKVKLGNYLANEIEEAQKELKNLSFPSSEWSWQASRKTLAESILI